ncbi:glycine zipper 2TM domain-containing protein [Massilia cavernae]|uniref:Glycine zipper 2TM domain-containing protein n=1 Tax=Massilia cavernae TaxID=2320864 RepID=A0A418Y791_9BURK|nr:glycine zipper 2TM domain-containing protein [Massilia cavernae]RJG24746.1 glycine zipper 2TM domain-containing protein [Massilia cavernae]
MNTPLHSTYKRPAMHPMLILAALAVILFCLAGTAAIMGWIPSSVGGNTPTRELTEADRHALSVQMLPAPPAQQVAPAANTQRYAMNAPAYGEPAPRRADPAPRHNEPLKRAPVKVAQAAPVKKWCSNCGNVESIRTITHRAEGSGLGAAGGAVLGGLLGSQIGGGDGKKLATVAGAVGGAVVGNQIEGNMRATRSYEIRVRLDDGTSRTFRQQSEPRWRTGQRVNVVNGSLRSVS